MATPELDDLISQREAGRRYGIGLDTLRRRVRRGDLRTYIHPMDDRVKLVRASDVEAMRIPRPSVVTPTERSVA
jgi:hypothetical protein